MKIAVLGDLIEDVYVYGKVLRISPEAPVPVFNIEKTETKSGGAHNVFKNIKSLTEDVVLCTKLPKNPIQKIRYLADGHYLFRADNENLESLIWESSSEYKTADIIVISDYNKGCIKDFQSLGVSDRSIVDPKKPLSFYSGAWCIKPNKNEFIQSEGGWNSDYELTQLMISCINKYNFTHLIITLGSDGVVYMNNTELSLIKIMSSAKEVYDVTGAGDTFTAVLAYGLSKNMTMLESINLANRAAGIAVSKSGTYVISKTDLELQTFKTVFTNGCFDILHKGHLEYLKQSKQLGKKLVVGINSDESIKRLKGVNRPINSCADRKFMLEQLSFVDEVVVFDEDTPYNLIKELKPDIITKGGDYKPENVVGNDLAEVVILPFLSGYSTTNIINRSKHDAA